MCRHLLRGAIEREIERNERRRKEAKGRGTLCAAMNNSDIVGGRVCVFLFLFFIFLSLLVLVDLSIVSITKVIVV